MNTVRALGWELRLQMRYGIGYAAAFVAFVWVLIMRALPSASLATLLPIALTFDTAIFGFYLMTGLMFMEKSDRSLAAVVVTPQSSLRYLGNKVATLSLVALAVCLAIVLSSYGPGVSSWPSLVAGVVIASAMMMLVGFALAARFRSINEYLLPSAIVLTASQFPMVHYFGAWSTPLAYLFPTQAPLLLLKGAFTPIPSWQIAYGLAYGAVGTVGALFWARRSFHRFVTGHSTQKAAPDRRRTPALRLRGVLALAVADFRNVRRDPVAVFMLIYALVIAGTSRWLIPWLIRVASPWVDLQPYGPVIISYLVVQAVPLILGVVVGLVLLDERDERSLLALRVSPLSLGRYALYRAALPMVLSVAICISSVHLIGMFVPPGVPLAAVALLASLEVPMVALALATFADNKVEGLALMKGMSLLLFAPVLAWFLDPPWRFVVGIVPPTWPALGFWRAGGIGGSPWWVLTVGFVLHLALLWWLARRFRSRVRG